MRKTDFLIMFSINNYNFINSIINNINDKNIIKTALNLA